MLAFCYMYVIFSLFFNSIVWQSNCKCCSYLRFTGGCYCAVVQANNFVYKVQARPIPWLDFLFRSCSVWYIRSQICSRFSGSIPMPLSVTVIISSPPASLAEMSIVEFVNLIALSTKFVMARRKDTSWATIRILGWMVDVMEILFLYFLHRAVYSHVPCSLTLTTHLQALS